LENYELDLKVLEDLCAGLDEPAFLLNKNHAIAWANDIFKNRYSITPGTDYNALKDAEFYDSSVLESFTTGKLTRIKIVHGHKTLRLISMPIRYNTDVLSILQIIEIDDAPTPKDTHLLKYFLDNIKNPAMLTDTDNNLIAANTHFNKAFHHIPELRDLLLWQLDYQSPKDVLKNMQRIIQHSHKIRRTTLRDHKDIIGYIYMLQKIKISQKIKK